MKVVLDLDDLLSHNKISQAEYSKLQSLAYQGTTSLAFTLLLTFGIVAITVGIVALSPTYLTVLMSGVALVLMSMGIQFGLPQWRLLADIVAVIGVLLAVMGLTGVPSPWLSSLWLSVLLLALASVWLHNGLLIALSVLTCFAALESSLYFYHASYGLSVHQPLIVVVFFSTLAWGVYRGSRYLPAHYSRLAIIASRVAVLLVNFGCIFPARWRNSD